MMYEILFSISISSLQFIKLNTFFQFLYPKWEGGGRGRRWKEYRRYRHVKNKIKIRSNQDKKIKPAYVGISAEYKWYLRKTIRKMSRKIKLDGTK